MYKSPILQIVELFVRNLYLSESNDNIYHGIKHTEEVVEMAKILINTENISKNDEEIILIACWFHDIGHLYCCHGHEEKSAQFAQQFLNENNYPEDKILMVVGCINATKIPQSPQNKLEEIICDADLYHLGESDIYERGQLLRKEFECRGVQKLSDIDWLKFSIDFFSKHKFFTDYAKERFEKQKKINKERMLIKLKELER